MANGTASLLGPIQNQLDALSPRDRKLLSGMFLFFGVVFVGFIAWTLRGQLLNKASRVEAQKEALRELQGMQSEYVTAAARIEAAESRLDQHKGTALPAYLEKTAASVGVRDALAVVKQGTEAVGSVEQTRYKVELKRVPYDLSLNFIYDIETGGYPLSIESTRVQRTRVKGDVVINVTLEVATYSIEEEG